MIKLLDENDKKEIEAKISLLLSCVPNSNQTVAFNADGTIQRVVHKGLDGNVVRTDSYTYSGNTITETRTLANGETMTFTINTNTLTMEVR